MATRVAATQKVLCFRVPFLVCDQFCATFSEEVPLQSATTELNSRVRYKMSRDRPHLRKETCKSALCQLKKRCRQFSSGPFSQSSKMNARRWPWTVFSVDGFEETHRPPFLQTPFDKSAALWIFLRHDVLSWCKYKILIFGFWDFARCVSFLKFREPLWVPLQWSLVGA